mmetsp:Transcript_111403/g.239974  ORF Transcript_111403/g.239974 Transcript_111403/m.239974 type:complete len:98 (+) Transcript_111403:302-595(+)
MCQLRDPLNERRAAMVKRCFAVMDVDGSGQIDSKDLKGIFNASENPEVIQKKKTEEEVFKEFLQSFEGTRGNHDGVISWEEWKAYYEELGMTILNDD